MKKVGKYDEIEQKWKKENRRDDIILIFLKIVFFLLVGSIIYQIAASV
jgi:hypothetical protein